MDALGDAWADALDVVEILLRGIHQVEQAGIALGDQLGHDRTDKANAQGGQQPVDRALLALLDAGLQVLHALFAVAFERADLIPGQVVDVGQVVDIALAHKQLGLLDAKALDVHRPARDEVLDRAHQLARAGAVDAVGGRFARRAHERLAADGAGGGHGPDPLFAGAQFGQRAQDLGDHLAGPLDDHLVADADVQVADVVLVV